MQSPSNPDRKIRVGIFFGGKSAEHEVSLQSAKNVLAALDRSKFEPVLIGIDKSGKWHFDAEQKLLDGQSVPTLEIKDSDGMVTLMPGGVDGRLVQAENQKPQGILDVAFPVLHGPMGEDGTIQGFLELANIPYVGPGILGSAVGMDKDVANRLLRDAGIPVADFEVVTAADLENLPIDTLVHKLGLPLFVKPANMGSSVGVSKVASAENIKTAVAEALRFDTKVLLEKAVVGDEIECAILGNNDPQASIIGRIIPRKNDFYSYAAKYINKDDAVLEIPANIPRDVAQKARETAIKAFKVLACEGMGRVDMFACEDGSIFVNEINTIPGFTKISMYPKLWEGSGLSYSELVTRLIDLALERHEQRQRLQTNYEGHI